MNTLSFFTVASDQPLSISWPDLWKCLLVTFGLSLAAALLLTPLARGLAHQRGWLDRPDGVRKLQPAPIPRIGGLAVYAAFFLAVAASVVCLPPHTDEALGMAPDMAHLLVAATLVMLVGLLDDVRGVTPGTKIAAQALAGFYLFLYGYRVATITNPFGGPPIELGWMAMPITVAWFVGMSNAFNLIDGLDGLAAGIGLFATAALLVSAAFNGRWSMVVLLCALAGALIGFLRYNFNPASIFLGDSGALFVGFVLAALAIRSSMKASAVVAVGAPLCALALPILDVLLSTLRRFITGHRIFEADHEHIHHRLLQRGLSPRRAVIALYGAAAVGGSLSLVTLTTDQQLIWGAACGVALLMWAGMRELGYAEFGEFGRVLMRRVFPERETVARSILLRNLRHDLARTNSLAESWDAVVAAAELLGFHRVAIAHRLSDDLLEWPITGRNGRPKRSFPVWEGCPSAAGHGHEWSWKVTLGAADSPIAEITMTRCAQEEPLRFEPSQLVTVISEGLGDAIRRLQSDPNTSATDGPAQVDLVGRVGRR